VLGAELIAAQACGEPWPLEADLVDAIDPARRLLRGAQS
jgi:tRNA 5-methylaminomethyl-2-thiouridine biosynthesis bifunctional protein